jgi:hypothetical protein
MTTLSNSINPSSTEGRELSGGTCRACGAPWSWWAVPVTNESSSLTTGGCKYKSELRAGCTCSEQDRMGMTNIKPKG